ncbi:5-formyltetrahydrofolate cyclo-ligase [Scopulibacillus daqui]|uniref:5-formyltetrahydrofolate cyclo-ligase n=1 Tax=Scopulibacillus daqui TaxID=1469162 RepID=A0ABS2Q256_9BACL|nr:5-formyltetrahydrofolate cyclo-ligase [Scopulibacillus daqui]MBM7646367.1 5-formyltetrahydrofolate cyclo-ligase [Scopulibacillus daqui]
MNEKTRLRKETLTALKQLSDQDFKNDCLAIKNNLIKQDEWRHAKVIGLTISRDREIQTRPIIEAAWQEGKIVVVPKCLPRSKQMVFRQITSYDQLETVYYGLLEPIEDKTAAVRKEKLNLVVVPGLVFDQAGYRIGFGGGYYDRFLEGYNGNTISLALDVQIKENIPKEPHDMPVQKIVTPTYVMSCS